MTMNLTDEDKRRLQEVVRAGRFKTEQEALSAAIRLLEPAPWGGQAAQLLPLDEWREEMSRIESMRTGGNPNADYSRDSIYGDDGR